MDEAVSTMRETDGRTLPTEAVVRMGDVSAVPDRRRRQIWPDDLRGFLCDRTILKGCGGITLAWKWPPKRCAFCGASILREISAEEYQQLTRQGALATVVSTSGPEPKRARAVAPPARRSMAVLGTCDEAANYRASLPRDKVRLVNSWRAASAIVAFDDGTPELRAEIDAARAAGKYVLFVRQNGSRVLLPALR